MKLKNYLIAFAIISIAAGVSSCKKNSSDSPASTELHATIELSGDQAISDNLNSDAENVLNEAAVDKDFAGSRVTGVSQALNVLSCAMVTVSSGGFPKTISIDFGAAGCTSSGGILRRGKISVVLSDSLRNSGCKAVMTFDNYYVGGFKKEGIVTWTYKNDNGIKSCEREDENGKIAAPDGRYWVHSGTQTVTQTGGTATPWDWSDDVFSTTGSATVTNSSGTSRTAEITAALEKKVICENIDKGTIKIQGPSHYVTIDFGDGTCDKIATFSVDGSNPIPFLLR
jgi:hypothetical protein